MEDDSNKEKEEGNYEMNERKKKKKKKHKYRVKEDLSTGKKELAGEGSRRKDGGEK